MLESWSSYLARGIEGTNNRTVSSETKFEYDEGCILGMGNPLLDISAEVPHEILEKYGLKPANAILAEEQHIPLYKELVDNYSVQYIAGGATQNSIRVAQWMTGKRYATGYMGCIGGDEFGRIIRECADRDGVRTHYMIDPSTPTGTCAVLVTNNERSLVANLAAANNFLASHLSTPEAQELIQKAKVYYIAGFFLTVSLESILTVAKHASDNSKTFCMNLSAPFLIQFFGEQMSAALPFCDIVFGNETEALTFGEARQWGTNIEEIALRISALPGVRKDSPRMVVITHGKDPTIVSFRRRIYRFPVELLPREKLIDTNGAGDAFVGGFLSRLVIYNDMANLTFEQLSDCVNAGHYASREIIQRSGCTLPEVCAYRP